MSAYSTRWYFILSPTTERSGSHGHDMMLVELVAMMVMQAEKGRCSAAKYPGDMVVISLCYYFIFLWSVQGSHPARQ